MASVSREMSGSPSRVFEVLSDGWLFAIWVVGASRMRAVDDGWPAVGSRLHHSVGGWPLLVSDETEVVEVVPPVRLVLHTKARPFGEALVDIDVEPAVGGSLVHLVERPVSGPGRWLHNPLSDAVLRRRNVESLDRLACLVEGRR